MNNTSDKGFKMALPFIAGAVAGGLAILAFNNRKVIKDKLMCGLEKGKDIAIKAKDETMSKLKKQPEKAPVNAKRVAKKTTTNKVKSNDAISK
ncbi:hypothetical protein [Campylobacter hyointestinalis]|uniref:hypothetical protein n=1 Tax=Campylobacter hyointestinalis TaxID=198 RepID=UPI000DCD21DE|nr:hypothetical protein [Campylobacter hyointestinalis]RAZ48756.1 hypothetical protein CHL14416_00510 [Campylobacter hyointestinalis subsp. lawsonii]RAZ50359.1 hypothetical protein CHL9004_02540 [Campylobacter hyointestinalis subsp. lawsonii]